MNPFDQPGRTPGDLRALCPWEVPEHTSWFVDVDHAREAFEAFRDSMPNGEPPSDPRAVIVLGGAGCGKTALVHRCAAHFVAGQTDSALVLDVTRERRPGVDSAAQLSHLAARIVDKLGFSGRLPATALDELKTRRHDPADLFPYLSDLLMATGLAVVLLLPVVETIDELRRSVSVSRPGVTVFVESTLNSVPVDVGTDRGDQIGVTVLRLGVLTADDGWRFVADRLGRVETAHLPSITKETVDRFMNVRIGGRGSTTIRELEKTCAGVFRRAIDSAREEISFSDFSEYYIASAELA